MQSDHQGQNTIGAGTFTHSEAQLLSSISYMPKKHKACSVASRFGKHTDITFENLSDLLDDEWCHETIIDSFFSLIDNRNRLALPRGSKRDWENHLQLTENPLPLKFSRTLRLATLPLFSFQTLSTTDAIFENHFHKNIAKLSLDFVDLILVPYNNQNNWKLLLIHILDHCFYWYDPNKSPEKESVEITNAIRKWFQKYLMAAYDVSSHAVKRIESWERVSNLWDFSPLPNISDSVFAIMFVTNCVESGAAECMMMPDNFSVFRYKLAYHVLSSSVPSVHVTPKPSCASLSRKTHSLRAKRAMPERDVVLIDDDPATLSIDLTGEGDCEKEEKTPKRKKNDIVAGYFDDRVPQHPLIHLPAESSEARAITPEMVSKFRNSWIFNTGVNNVQTESIDSSLLFAAIMIPANHRARLYFKTSTVIALVRCASLLASEMVLKFSRSSCSFDAVQIQEYDSQGSGSMFWIWKKTELEHRGFCTLENFSDYTAVLEKFPELRNSAEKYLNDPLHRLFTFVEKEFPFKESETEMNENGLWNPIINHGVSAIDKIDRSKGMGRYITTRKFVMDYMESSHGRIWASKRRALLDAWIAILLTLLGIDDNEQDRLFLTNTGGRWIETGAGCPAQCSHNDFEVGSKSRAGYFYIVSGKTGFFIWACEGSHKFVLYTEKERESLKQILKLDLHYVPPESIFIGHGYLQHAGAGYDDHKHFHGALPSFLNDKKKRLSGYLRYHGYVHSEKMKVPDSISFAFRGSLTIRRKV